MAAYGNITPVVAVGDVLEFKFYCNVGGQVGINVAHYGVSAVGGFSQTFGAVVSAVSTIFAPLYKPLLSSVASFGGLQMQRIRPAPTSAPVATVDDAGAGTVAGDPLPFQVSSLITLRTAFAGRKFRGRRYIPFAAEADNDAAQGTSAAYNTRLITLGNACVNSIGVGVGADTATLLPVIFHRGSGLTDRITSSVPHRGWATQRRRGAFGALNPPGPPA